MIAEIEYLLSIQDWEYQFSDDFSVWNRGQANFDKLKAALYKFEKEDITTLKSIITHWAKTTKRTNIPFILKGYITD